MTLTTVCKPAALAGTCAGLEQKEKKFSGVLVGVENFMASTCNNRAAGVQGLRSQDVREFLSLSLSPLSGSLLRKEKDGQNVLQLRCRDTRFTEVETDPAEVNR